MKSNKKKYIIITIALVLGYFTLNAIRIYTYSSEYSEVPSDVAIVLGAGTDKGVLSPVFKERVNHSIMLFEKGVVGKIIFTGGFGSGQKQSDSQIAKHYAIREGVPENSILIEEKSNYTSENLIETKHIMDSLNLKSALLVSDPLHMKRSMKLADYYGLECKPSPTKSTMYKSAYTKMKLLFSETCYFTLREPLCLF